MNMATKIASRLANINPSLYVGNIPWTIGNQELKDYFGKFGKVVRANIVFDRQTGYHKGFGFILLKDKESAQNVLQESQHKLDGRVIEVKIKENQF